MNEVGDHGDWMESGRCSAFFIATVLFYDFDLFPGCDVQIDTKYLEQQKWLRQGPVSRLV